MSFFPSADPDDEQTPYAESQPFFSAQNTLPTGQHTSVDQFDFNFAYATTSTHGLPNCQPSTWAPAYEAPQGLGLQYSTGSLFPAYTFSTAFSQPSTTSFTWPADFTPTQTPIPSAPGFRRDSCSNSSEPPSTVQPSQLWEPFHPVAGPVASAAPSPGRSEYSTSSHQSTTSSPFVRSDGHAPPVASPLVKIESESAASNSPLFPGVLGPQERAAIEARDFASPAATSRDRQLSFAASSEFASDAEDIKTSVRPRYRRAYSAADTEESRCHDRRKRSLTRPENASCSCEICGKLFQRCYNLKAHMETHESNRNMPNKCKFPGCGKKFVRRTDLTRHNESVHIKARPFECSRCHNTFARKDTLQRHFEDGCPMRPEVRKRSVTKSSRDRTSPTIKEEPESSTPQSHATLSPATIRRLREA